MKISIFILLIGLVFTGLLFGQAADLFISEYVEGFSNNQAIEIYNGTGSSVDMSVYTIKRTNNGSDWTKIFTFPDNTILQSYDVYVIANASAIQGIIDVADITLAYNEDDFFISFDGNDAIGLFKNDTLIDLIGKPNIDPGNGWDVAGISDATKDHTLIRKPDVTQGNIDWDSSAGTNEENSEWLVNNVDYISDLGQHTFNGAPDLVPPTVISANAVSETEVDIIFSEDITTESAENIENYQINNGLTLNSATLQSDNRTVTLQTSQQTENTQYTITINNIKDLAGNTIETNTTVNFTGYVNPYTSIAEIRENITQYTGQQVTIKAIVSIGAGVLRTDKLNAFVQDETKRGIEIFDYDITEDYLNDFVKGNELEITGTVDVYNQVAEIKNFTYSVISTGNEIPTLKLKISQCYDLSLEGTYIQTTGIVTDSYYAGGGTNIEISDNKEPPHSLPIRVWDSTGIDCSEFETGFILQVKGVATIYNNNIQISPGYQEDLTEGTLNPYDFLIITPQNPVAGEDLTLTFNNENTVYDFVNINWKTNKDLAYHTEKMESNIDNNEFTYTFKSPKAGTKFEVYFETFNDTTRMIFPENAPDEPIEIDIPSQSLIAKITIPAKPFNPRAGELFPIEISGSNGDKAIIRIYDIQGRLKTTLYNSIISTASGIVRINWDGKDKNYNILPVGLYICHLEVIDRNSGKSKTDKAPIMIGTELK